MLRFILILICAHRSIAQTSMSSVKKVLITTDDVPGSAIDMLSQRYETIIIKHSELSKDKLVEKIKGVDGVLWATHINVDTDILNAAGPKLKIIGSMSAGVDHMDLQELKKRGIRLTNTSPALKDAVANLAVLLALAASRRMQEGRQHIETGTWTGGNQWMLGRDISGSTVGIVGFGEIGQAIARKLQVFNVKQFLYSGHREKPEAKELNAKMVPFQDLLRDSDFVIVACPLTPETAGMFNETAFSKMKNTAVFLNIARGGIVDQPALVKALQENRIFAAGLDVTTPEPLPTDHPLISLPNCVLIPHLGSATLQTRAAMAELAASNIIKALSGEALLTPVV